MKKKDAKGAQPNVTPLLHDIPETQVLLGNVSRTKVYDLLDSGQLESVMLGSRRLPTHRGIVRLVARLLKAVA